MRIVSIQLHEIFIDLGLILHVVGTRTREGIYLCRKVFRSQVCKQLRIDELETSIEKLNRGS